LALRTATASSSSFRSWTRSETAAEPGRLLLAAPRSRGFLGTPGQRRRARIRPFLTAGAAAILSATDLDSETKLSFGLGADIKWLPSKWIGARLQAKYMPTYLNDTGSDICDPFGFCQSWLHQFELSGGVVLRF
jgi:hypothetical protein